jgi:hypothetical protein
VHWNALFGCGVFICVLVSGLWIRVFEIILYCFTDFVEVRHLRLPPKVLGHFSFSALLIQDKALVT